MLWGENEMGKWVMGWQRLVMGVGVRGWMGCSEAGSLKLGGPC